jgi:outer membrane protein
MKRSLPFLAASALAAAIAAPAAAHEAGDWIVRAGVGVVDPKNDNLNLGSVDLGGGISLASASLQVDNATSMTLMGTYMFTPNWAIDVLASWPFKHDINVSATISDGVTTESGTVKLGSTEHLPPTVSLQYHFMPDGKFQPYAGLGANYTTFMSEELTSDAQDAGISGLSLDSSFGVAGQLGADWMINDQWLVNFDLRYIKIGTDATLTIDDGTGPVSGSVGTVDIDPWVYSLNLGFRF